MQNAQQSYQPFSILLVVLHIAYASSLFTLRLHLATMDFLPDQHVLLHQVDSNPLNAAAKSGNEELAHWLVDECGVPHVYNRVSISQKLRF